MTAARRTITLFGLAIAVILPAAGPVRFLPAVPGLNPLYLHELFWWGLTILVLLYVLLVERRALRTIGFRLPDWRSLAYGALAAIVIGGGMFAIATFLLPALHLKLNAQALHSLLDTPLWFRVLLVTRAAVMEETLFRGYGIERLRELTGSSWVAGVVTLALFTLAHLSTWGWAQLIIAGYGGLILTLLYFWRRDLVCNMIAHWITDAIGVLTAHG